MQISGMPNKFEIFQDFYFEINGVKISYNEALRLFYKMDEVTKNEFEEYFKDEVGYEIITPTGYNFDGKSSKSDINIKYTLDAYAKKNNFVLDPQWAVFSAEEIIQMADGGVNIPKEVLDIANTVIQTTLNTKIASEGEDSENESEKDSFMNLIPKAQKKIKKCNIYNKRIEDKIEDILPEKSKMEKSFTERMKNQKRSLEEYEAHIREWNKLQTKINNGEDLSQSEARRYANLTGMFNDKKSDSNDSDFSINKRQIAKLMNELNILSIIGEQLADETIEIGETLTDYTSNFDYKAGKVNKQIGQTGLLRSISLMAFSKDIAKMTVMTGSETKEYTKETQSSVNDIAQILDIGGLITGKDEVLSNQEVKTEQPDSKEAVQDAKEQPAETTESAQGEEKNPEVTPQEDFVINDKNVKELIKEASDINSDLAKQTVNAVKGFKIARNNRKFAKIAGFKVTILVKRFKDEEEKRQEKIQELKKENKNADEELKELTGKTAEELDKEQQTVKETEQGDSNKKPQDKTNEVKVLRSKIISNNSEIENINTESETAKNKFANATAKENEFISQAIPKELNALEYNNKYKEEVIPAAQERLDFTNASGETLLKIGMYRIEIGMMQIMAWQLIKGLRNVALGTISTGIGVAAQATGDSPLPKIAEKSTDKTVKEEDESINALSELEAKIISVTGAEATSTDKNSEDAEDSGETLQTEDTKANNEENIIENNQVEDTNMETPKIPDVSTSSNSTKNTETTSSTRKDESPEALASNANKQESQLDKQTDAQNDIVKESNKTAKDAGKESKKIEKDEKKNAKQLEKEAKQLEKQIKQEEQEVIKLTQESQKAVEKQEQAYAVYESLAAENEQLMAEEEAKQSKQTNQNNTQGLVSNSFTVTNTSDGMSNNQSKLLQNSMLINELGVVFKSQDRIVIRNKARISTIRDSINNKSIKFEKKLKIKDKQIKETEKKEQEKQKQLTKTMAAIGIAENVFSITSSTGKVLIAVGAPLEAGGAALITAGTVEIATGTPMLSNPITAAAGAALIATGTAQVTTGTTMETSGITLQSIGSVLKTVGLVGNTACGVTKGIINIANGNLAGGLMAIGASALSVATSFAGSETAAGGVLTYVTEGLNIVSSTAELTNNVRAVQGKESSGVASKIATIAGVGSALSGATSSVTNMGNQNLIGKISTIASAAGTALSSTSQVMSEFELGDEKTAQTLGTIGGALQTAGSIGQMFGSNKQKENDTNEIINNDKNIKAEDKAKIDTALEKMANDPEVQNEILKTQNDPELQAQVNKERDAIIDKTLNDKNTDDKTKTKVKENIQKSENNKDVVEQPQVDIEKTETTLDSDAENTDKTSKKEKFNNIIDLTTQALDTTGQVITLLTSQNATNAQEGETKKKKAAPGKLTQRTLEIIKKNERYRQKIIKALAKSQKYYA